jgi:hypothetical protein
VLLAAILIVAGFLLQRASFDAKHALRVAGWATLGTVVLGLVVVLIVIAGTAVAIPDRDECRAVAPNRPRGDGNPSFNGGIRTPESSSGIEAVFNIIISTGIEGDDKYERT